MSAIPAPTAPAASFVSFRTRLETFSRWLLRPEVLIRVSVYLTTLIYLRTVLFDYVYDDNYLIILNPWMDSWKYVPTIFTHSFWSFSDAVRGVDFYRPLVMLTLVSIRHLLGPAPGWFHLVSAGVHVLATYLTYRLAVETTGDGTLAAISAGIFGLHPTKVETAAWISGISDSLCVVFFLGSMIAYFKWRKERGSEDGRRYLSISLILLLLALFSKEAAIFAPALIATYEFASTKAAFRDRCRATLRFVWPFAAVTALVLGVRFSIVRTPAGHVLNTIPILTTLLTAPKTILWYLGKQIWPVGLSVQYPKLVITRVSTSNFIVPFVLLLALSAIVLRRVRKSPNGIFFVSWFALTLAPVIVYQVQLQEHDRYFYLASIASSIGLGYLISCLKDWSPAGTGVAVAATLAGMAILTVSYCSYWDNDMALFTRAVQIAPENHNACRYLAGIYINQNQPEKSESIARSLLKTSEHRAVGWYILSSAHLAEKDYEQARRDMQNAVFLSQGEKNPMPSIALADIDVLLNRNQEALQIYQQELKEYPHMNLLHARLATTLNKMGKPDEAARELELQKRSSGLP